MFAATYYGRNGGERYNQELVSHSFWLGKKLERKINERKKEREQEKMTPSNARSFSEPNARLPLS